MTRANLEMVLDTAFDFWCVEESVMKIKIWIQTPISTSTVDRLNQVRPVGVVFWIYHAGFFRRLIQRNRTWRRRMVTG